MKRNTLIAAGAALVLSVCANINLAQAQAQAQPAPTPPGTAPSPMPGNPGAPNPAMRRPMGPMGNRPLRFTIPMTLRNLHDLQKGLAASQDDLGGHKQTAIDACDKAITELEAVMKTLPAPTPPPQRPVAPSAAPSPSPAPAPAPAPGAPPATTPQTPVPQK